MAMYETEEGLKKIAEFCRSSKGVPVKQAIERLRSHHDTDRRVEYFRGEKLVTLLLGDVGADSKDAKKDAVKKKPATGVFQAKDVEEAGACCVALLREGYIHRSTRTGKGQLEFNQLQKWEPAGMYVWDYEGSKGLSHFLTGLLIVGMLTVTCFPIWPHFLKVYLWYCSVTLLIFMIVFITIRMILFLFLWILGYDFWIFPNLFDESLSVVDSFKPVYSYENGAEGQRYYRAALVSGTFAFFVYCYNQPTDFDTFLEAQKDFVSDLYEGKLLTDTSQNAKDDIDKIKRPSFEQLAQEEEEEAKERRAREDLEQVHEQSASDQAYEAVDFEAEDEAAADMIEKMLAEAEAEDDEDE